MAEIGIASGHFDVESHHDVLGWAGFHGVNFHARHNEEHHKPGFQLILHPDRPQRILVEGRAERWVPDPPTRATYCQAVTAMVGPLLSTFNRSHGRRYRLRVLKGAEFRLSDRTTVLLDRFVVLANKASLHPLDWQRFYCLVREGRQQIPEPVLRDLLRARGFPPDNASRLAETYRHLWAFKRLA